MMVIKSIRLCYDHIGKISVKGVAPQITGILRPFGICGDIVPMVRHLDSEIPGAAVDSQPSIVRLFILPVFNEMIASAERAETFVKNGFLQFYPAAEIRNKTRIYA